MRIIIILFAIIILIYFISNIKREKSTKLLKNDRPVVFGNRPDKMLMAMTSSGNTFKINKNSLDEYVNKKLTNLNQTSDKIEDIVNDAKLKHNETNEHLTTDDFIENIKSFRYKNFNKAMGIIHKSMDHDTENLIPLTHAHPNKDSSLTNLNQNQKSGKEILRKHVYTISHGNQYLSTQGGTDSGKKPIWEDGPKTGNEVAWQHFYIEEVNGSYNIFNIINVDRRKTKANSDYVTLDNNGNLIHTREKPADGAGWVFESSDSNTFNDPKWNPERVNSQGHADFYNTLPLNLDVDKKYGAPWNSITTLTKSWKIYWSQPNVPSTAFNDSDNTYNKSYIDGTGNVLQIQIAPGTGGATGWDLDPEKNWSRGDLESSIFKTLSMLWDGPCDYKENQDSNPRPPTDNHVSSVTHAQTVDTYGRTDQLKPIQGLTVRECENACKNSAGLTRPCKSYSFYDEQNRSLWPAGKDSYGECYLSTMYPTWGVDTSRTRLTGSNKLSAGCRVLKQVHKKRLNDALAARKACKDDSNCGTKKTGSDYPRCEQKINGIGKCKDCNSRSDCNATHYCNSDKVCIPKLAVGDTIPHGNDHNDCIYGRSHEKDRVKKCSECDNHGHCGQNPINKPNHYCKEDGGTKRCEPKKGVGQEARWHDECLKPFRHNGKCSECDNDGDCRAIGKRTHYCEFKDEHRQKALWEPLRISDPKENNGPKRCLSKYPIGAKINHTWEDKRCINGRSSGWFCN